MAAETENDRAQPVEGLRVLVIGATGFVGSAIVDECVRAGIEVVTTGRRAPGPDAPSNYFQADITKPGTLASAMSNVNCVIHAAGLAHQFQKTDDELFIKNNIEGTANVARAAAAAGVKHFVLISSITVYGRNDGVLVDETAACAPQTFYAQSKLLAEERAIDLLSTTGACVTVLRLTVVYGEGDGGNIFRLMRAIDRNRFVWIGKGENRKTIVHRDDVARACVAVLKRQCTGVNIYNIAGYAPTMRELVEIMSNELGRKPWRFRIPKSLALAGAKTATILTGGYSKVATLRDVVKKWLVNDLFDGTKFRRDFDFEPEVTLQEGIRREVEWYRKRVR
jgi:nucleoside-diphosphate-sugar epimerase